MITVVAAVLVRDGMILIGQRPVDRAHAGKWEFPGGKVGRGETPRECLVRELREELGVLARPGDLLHECRHHYPERDLHVHLLFHAATLISGEPAPLEHASLCWVAPADLADYDFLEADLDFIRALALGGVTLPVG